MILAALPESALRSECRARARMARNGGLPALRVVRSAAGGLVAAGSRYRLWSGAMAR